MFDRRVQEEIEHKEAVGTGDLLKDTLRRYDDLDRIRGSLLTCLKTQALAWHVLSLFPGETATAELWKEEIMKSVTNFSRMQAKIHATMEQDVERFQALFNLESTLEARRAEVKARAKRTALAVKKGASGFQTGMNRTALMIEHNSDPIRLGLEVIDGEIQQVRLLA